MTKTAWLIAGVGLVALLATLLAVTFSYRPEPVPRDASTDNEGSFREGAADDRRLERIEERLEAMLDRIGRIERTLAQRDALSSRPADSSRLPESAASSPPRADDARTAVTFDQVPTRHLVLQADERLKKGTDVAGAVARFEALLERSLDLEQRIDVLRKTGLAYGRLGYEEDARRYLRRAVALGAENSAAAAPAVHDLILVLGSEDDRELLDLAPRYLESEHANGSGRLAVHRAVASAARRLRLLEREKVSLRYVAKWGTREGAAAQARLRELGEE